MTSQLINVTPFGHLAHELYIFETPRPGFRVQLVESYLFLVSSYLGRILGSDEINENAEVWIGLDEILDSQTRGE